MFNGVFIGKKNVYVFNLDGVKVVNSQITEGQARGEDVRGCESVAYVGCHK